MGSEKDISNEAVKAATGKTWKQWFAILDRHGAKEKSHREIARHLAGDRGLDPWWSQTVTVRYELDRGLRVVGQRGSRFEVSVTRTVDTTPQRAFRAFTNAKDLSTWFTTRAKADARPGGKYANADGDRGEFLRVEPPRRLAFTWDNEAHCPGTRVDVDFEPVGDGRTRIRLTHGKLESAEDREDMKEGWSFAMDSLKSWLETDRPIPHERWLREREERHRGRGGG